MPDSPLPAPDLASADHGPDSALDGQASQRPAITPFWLRLNSFFLFPLQLEPLLLMGLLALLSYLLLLPHPARALVFLGIVLGASRYAFKVAALASRGVLHSREYTHALSDPDWKVLPWKFFVILVLHGSLITYLDTKSEVLGMGASLVSSFMLPATLMVLIQSFSLRASLNPLELLATMTGVGPHYLLLCLFLFLLLMGFPQALQLLVPIAPDWLLPPLIVSAGVYFLWVMAALIGYVMYQHHGALQIDVLRTPAPEAGATQPVPTPAQRRDTEVAALVQAGDLKEAIAQAREWARTGYDNVSDQRRYHRVLLLDDPQSGRLHDHAQRFIPLLLAQQHTAEALQVHAAVAAKLPGFALSQADHTLTLAEQAWKQMDARQAIALLRGFDKRFAGDTHIPQAYELIIRALKQGLGRGDKALPVYHTLRKRYPQHPTTQEAAWVLREELGTTASAQPARAPSPAANRHTP
ncbi:MAG: hypothetical protein Q4F13_15070 [Pseudomonadota bacterium]|nr:hypothetical protein [Pseudomonadota bacterium]